MPTILSSSSSSSNDSLDDERSGPSETQETAEQQQHHPNEARDHSYLPGTSHPLYPESLWQQQQRAKTKYSQLVKLAILELDGVVLFPRQTLPLRLRHPQWRTYLGESIDARRAQTEAVCIGVVTREAPRLDRQRGSWLRRAIHRRPFPLELFLAHHPQEEGDDVDSSSDDGAMVVVVRPDGEMQVDYDATAELQGDIAAVDNERESRHNAVGANEEETNGADEPMVLSENQVQENDAVGANEEETNGADEPMAPSENQVRENEAEVSQPRSRRWLSRSSRSSSGQSNDSNSRRGLLRRRLRSRSSGSDAISEADSSNGNAPNGGGGSSSSSSSVRPDFRSLRRLSHHRSPTDAARMDDDDDASRPRSRTSSFPQLDLTERAFPSDPNDPLINKIGTMAVISHRYGGDDDDDVVDVGDPFGPIREQLIITASGTARFRIVSRVNLGEETGNDRGYGDMARVRLYWCQVLLDEQPNVPSLPFHRQLGLSADADHEASGLAYFDFHDRLLQELSQTTPVPYFVYKRLWPWRLVGLIREALDRIDIFEGLRKNLPALDGPSDSRSPLEPVAFSFWMANHMSLKEEEKVKLLKMNCLVERLRYIYAKVIEQERFDALVCCRNCMSRVSRASSMFTVGGCEGTTGAYVNEHGIVHQTITLRRVNENNLFYSGGPETKDSWFPGYSWIIASCRSCYSHLGWKFQRVGMYTGTETDSETDRPSQFWGLSGASVTTSQQYYNADDDTT